MLGLKLNQVLIKGAIIYISDPETLKQPWKIWVKEEHESTENW